jgi:uncharacterized protein (TIGR03067 family)
MGWAAVLVLAAVVGADDKNKADKSRGDKDKVQGTWMVTRGEEGGQKVSAETLKGTTVVFKEDYMTVKDRADNKTWVVVFQMDASKKPKEITMTLTTGKDKGKISKGIYSLEGDVLKLCYAMPGYDRPTSFSTKKDAEQHCFILKRGKAKTSR